MRNVSSYTKYTFIGSLMLATLYSVEWLPFSPYVGTLLPYDSCQGPEGYGHTGNKRVWSTRTAIKVFVPLQTNLLLGFKSEMSKWAIRVGWNHWLWSPRLIGSKGVVREHYIPDADFNSWPCLNVFGIYFQTKSPIIDHRVTCMVVLRGRDDQALVVKQIGNASWGGVKLYCYVYAKALDPIQCIVYFGTLCFVGTMIPYVGICRAQVIWEQFWHFNE